MEEREKIAWVNLGYKASSHMGLDWYQVKVAMSRVPGLRACGFIVEILGIDE